MRRFTHDETGVAPGLVLAVVSAASFGLAGPLASGLMDAGWSAAVAVAARVLVAAAVLAPFAVVRLRGRWWLLVRHAPTLLGFGLVAVAGCQLAYFNAVRHLPVGIALLIEYVSPLAVVAWLWLRGGQRPTRLTVAGGVVAAAGLVLVLDLVGGAQASGALSVVGVLWATAAMVGNAFYFVVAADPGDPGAAGDEELPGIVLAAGGMLVGGAGLLVLGACGLLPLAVATRPVRYAGLAIAVPWWACAVGLGVITAGVAYATGIAATRRLGSRLASFVAMGEVLAALAFAWLLLGQVPGPVQAAGGVLVLVGVVLVERGEPTEAAGPAGVPLADTAPVLSGRPGGVRTPR